MPKWNDIRKSAKHSRRRRVKMFLQRILFAFRTTQHKSTTFEILYSLLSIENEAFPISDTDAEEIR